MEYYEYTGLPSIFKWIGAFCGFAIVRLSDLENDVFLQEKLKVEYKNVMYGVVTLQMVMITKALHYFSSH